jgi:hypothetical protein
MQHGVLKHWHPMIGRDKHIPWFPGAPAPSPTPLPYVTFMTLHGFGLTCKEDREHFTDYLGFTMLKGTDIGPLIPHFGPLSLLTPLDYVFSYSKSHFSTSRYQDHDQPIAVSLCWLVNPNLNCGTPIPSFTGFAVALTSHRVDMDWQDVFAGMAAMAVDAAILWGIGWLGGKVVGPLVASWISGKVMPRALAWLQARLAIHSRAWARAMQEQLAKEGAIDIAHLDRVAADKAAQFLNEGGKALGDKAFSFLLGGPAGLDYAPLTGLPTGGGTASGLASDAAESGAAYTAAAVEAWYDGQQEIHDEPVDDYLNDPDVEEYPSYQSIPDAEPEPERPPEPPKKKRKRRKRRPKVKP